MKTIWQFAINILAKINPLAIQVAAVDDRFIHRLQFFRPFNGRFELDCFVIWAVGKQLNLWWTNTKKESNTYNIII